MEKPQLINFIAKVMEDSGFKVYKNFKTSRKVVDIYAILPTTIGDFGVVVACKNFNKEVEIGIDVLKDMEKVQESLKASRVTIVTSSYFSNQAKKYADRKNIKLVDRDNLLEMAKKYQDRTRQTTLDDTQYDGGASSYIDEQYPEYSYDASDMEYLMQQRASDPHVYQNSLYRQEEPQRGGLSSFLNSRNPQPRGNLNPYTQTNLYNYNKKPSLFGQDSLLFKFLDNPIGLILVVVFISYVVSRICTNSLGMDSGFSGLIEMFIALVLSYGLSFYTVRNTDFIVKGTFIFFISLVILIMLIFI